MSPRLTLAVFFAACAVLAPRGGEAQPPRIALLSIGTNPDPTNQLGAVLRGLTLPPSIAVRADRVIE